MYRLESALGLLAGPTQGHISSVFTACRAEEKTFQRALNFFAPYEAVLKKLERSQSVNDERLDATCLIPFREVYTKEGTKKERSDLLLRHCKNSWIRVSSDGSRLYLESRGGQPKRSFKEYPLPLGRALARCGEVLQASLRFPNGSFAAWILSTQQDRPLIKEADIYNNF